MNFWDRLTFKLWLWLYIHVAQARAPDYVVGANSPGGPYLLRWYLTPWRRWRDQATENPTTWRRFKAEVSRWLPNLYLHRFQRDDDDRALHDHPAMSLSWMLKGPYIEHTIAAGGIHHRELIDSGTVRFRRATHAHRIELIRYSGTNEPMPAWTLFLFGPVVFGREWGFHCPEQGWIHWEKFTADGRPGEVGDGCEA